jgi:hypothetical protein
VLMALGGVLAVLDRRYRAQRRVAAPSPAPRQGDPATALAGQSGTP